MALSRWLLPAGILSLLLSFSSAKAADDKPVIHERSLPGRYLNDLALWDVGNDGIFEIFVTDSSGEVSCYSAVDLEPVWTRVLTRDALTAPVVGDFMGTGAPILATASIHGTVYFVWPGSGEVISSLETDWKFSLAPSVAPRSAGDDVVFADDRGAVVGFHLDPSSGLPLESFRVDNTIDQGGLFSVIGAILQPPSCADLDGDGGTEILTVSKTGILQLISLPEHRSERPVRIFKRQFQNNAVTTLAGIGSLSESGDVWFGYGVGTRLEFFQWKAGGSGGDPFGKALEASAFGEAQGHLLFGQLNEDATPDLLSGSDKAVAARYLGRDLSGGVTLLDVSPAQLLAEAPPLSLPGPVTLKDGKKAVIAVDSAGTLYCWRPDSEEAPQRVAGIPVPSLFAPVGDFTGTGKATAVIWNMKAARLSVVSLPINLAPASQVAPCLTFGANFSRNGQWGTLWNEDYRRRLAKAEDALQRARKSAETQDGDTPYTTDAISQIAGMDPADPLASHLKRDTRNENIVKFLAAVGTGFLLAAAGVFAWRRRR